MATRGTGRSAPRSELTPLDILRLADVFALAVPIMAASTLLVLKTRQIRGMQKRYNIQMVIFRNIMIVGYLFFFAGFFYLAEAATEWIGLGFYALVTRISFHLLVLAIIVAITLSLYQYYRFMAMSPEGSS